MIRETYYLNSKVGKDFGGKKFTVRCSDMNGRFKSNEFVVEVSLCSILHAMSRLYDIAL